MVVAHSRLQRIQPWEAKDDVTDVCFPFSCVYLAVGLCAVFVVLTFMLPVKFWSKPTVVTEK